MTPAMKTTDDEGRYEIRGLAAGHYTVNKLGGRMAAPSDDGMLASVTDGLMTKSVDVPKGAVVTLDFDGRRSGVTLTGRVTSAGEPVAKAFLSFAPLDLPDDDESSLRIATTDADGTYEITGLAPGEWTVTIQSGASLSDSIKQTFDVDLPDRPGAEEDFALEVTGIAGIVTARGQLTPIAGVRVAITSLGGAAVDAITRAAGSSRVADVITGPDGRYRASGLRPGSYRVVAGGPGMFGIGGGLQQSDPVEVSVGVGQLVEGVDFVLEEGAAIEGEVADEDGRGVVGAALFFEPLDGDAERHFGEVISDEAGRYRADGLRPGRFRVAAKASGYAPAVAALVSTRRGEVTECDLTLRRGGRLVIDVTDADGAPVAGAAVRILSADGIDYCRFVSISEAMSSLGAGIVGRHDLGPIPSGSYTCVVSAGDASVQQSILHGSDDQVVSVTLE